MEINSQNTVLKSMDFNGDNAINEADYALMSDSMKNRVSDLLSNLEKNGELGKAQFDYSKMSQGELEKISSIMMSAMAYNPTLSAKDSDAKNTTIFEHSSSNQNMPHAETLDTKSTNKADNKTVFNTPQKTTVVDNKPAKNPIESYNKSVLERLFPAEGFVAKSADNQPKKYSKPASAENTPESPKALAKSFVYDDEFWKRLSDESNNRRLTGTKEPTVVNNANVEVEKAQAANNVAVPNAGVPKKTENSAIYSNPNVIGVADDIIAEFENNHGYSFDYTYRKNGNTINVCNVNDVYHVQVKNDNMKYSQTIGNIKKGELVFFRDGNIVSEKLPNGKIDNSFIQGDVGDCWLLAPIKALMSREEGQKILDNSICVNDDGSVTVHLNGKNKTYTISLDELMTEKGSCGDMDVKALELAIKKYLEEENSSELGDIDGNFVTTATDILIGSLGTSYKNVYSDDFIDSFNDKDKIFVAATKLDDSGKQTEGHAIAILRFDKDYVYTMDPHSHCEKRYTRSEFRSRFYYVAEMKIA